MKAVLIIIISVFLIYIVGTFIVFNLSGTSIHKLKTIPVTAKPYKIILYKIDGDATVQSGIQVRESRDRAEEHTLKHYDRYDSLLCWSISKNKLTLVLKNTSISGQKSDTLHLDLP